MRKIREALRLHLGLGLSLRQTAQSLSVAYSTVADLMHRAKAAELTWPLSEDLDDAALEKLLYPGNQGRPRTRPEPDWNWVHRELSRKGVTLELLWLEYRQEHPDGYQYSQFCAHYQRWCEKLDVVLRQHYRAGEKMFVDYAGTTVPVRARGGAIRQAYIFVAVLGASNYTYAEAHGAPDLPSWIGGHVRAFEFFGGVPEIVVPDNPKTAVKLPCWYEPDLNPTYQEMAAHYGTVVIPARPRRPRDKAKVEAAVLVVERWILAALRHRTFTGVTELNEAIWELLDRLNDRPFRKLPGSRRSLFETLDKPALKPLPPTPYEFAEWKKAKVNIDYCVEVFGNYYSVPYQLVREVVDVRITAHTVEVFHKGRRVASHPRLTGKGASRVDDSHRPASHRAYLEWTPSRIVNWARSVGPNTAKLIETILKDRPHPEQGYRSCLGILRLGKRYPRERVEAAAQRALAVRAHSYRSVKSILEKGLDQQPLESPQHPLALPDHANLRGPGYYAPAEGSVH